MPQQAPAAATHPHTQQRRRRVAVVGIGHRAGAWLTPATGAYADRVEVVALCDPVLKRCHDAIERWALNTASAYDDLDTMLAEQRPDQVIACLPESMHADVIVKALDAGATVATEKPLCTTGEDAARILDAERRAAQPILMGFNYRHIPLCTKIKALIVGGAIGTPTSADLTWYLDYKGHGGSYFRRWHGEMAKSGGLLITKATHHFDLANWWLGDKPRRVYAECDRRFFGAEHSPFGSDHARRCRECHQAETCDMYRAPIDAEQRSRELGYRVREVADFEGDLCVYRDAIDIYDTHGLTVRYAGGALLNYTLNAAAPFEGWNLALNGTNGRLETGITDAKPVPGWQQHYAIAERGDTPKILDHAQHQVLSWPSEYKIHVMPHDRVDYQVAVPNIVEGHGGGDAKIMEAAYGDGPPDDDPLHTFAHAIDGARSMAIGAAANRSASEQRAVPISEIIGEWA